MRPSIDIRRKNRKLRCQIRNLQAWETICLMIFAPVSAHSNNPAAVWQPNHLCRSKPLRVLLPATRKAASPAAKQLPSTLWLLAIKIRGRI